MNLLPIDCIHTILCQCDDYDDIIYLLLTNNHFNKIDHDDLWICLFFHHQFDIDMWSMYPLDTRSNKMICRTCFHITLLKQVFDSDQSLRFWFTTNGLICDINQLMVEKYFLSLPRLAVITIIETNQFNITIPSVLNDHPTLKCITIKRKQSFV